MSVHGNCTAVVVSLYDMFIVLTVECGNYQWCNTLCNTSKYTVASKSIWALKQHVKMNHEWVIASDKNIKINDGKHSFQAHFTFQNKVLKNIKYIFNFIYLYSTNKHNGSWPLCFTEYKTKIKNKKERKLHTKHNIYISIIYCIQTFPGSKMNMSKCYCSITCILFFFCQVKFYL